MRGGNLYNDTTTEEENGTESEEESSNENKGDESIALLTLILSFLFVELLCQVKY